MLKFYRVGTRTSYACSWSRHKRNKEETGCSVAMVYSRHYVKACDEKDAIAEAEQQSTIIGQNFLRNTDWHQAVKDIYKAASDYEYYKIVKKIKKIEIRELQITAVESHEVEELKADEVLRHFTFGDIVEEVVKLL